MIFQSGTLSSIAFFLAWFFWSLVWCRPFRLFSVALLNKFTFWTWCASDSTSTIVQSGCSLLSLEGSLVPIWKNMGHGMHTCETYFIFHNLCAKPLLLHVHSYLLQKSVVDELLVFSHSAFLPLFSLLDCWQMKKWKQTQNFPADWSLHFKILAPTLLNWVKFPVIPATVPNSFAPRFIQPSIWVLPNHPFF